MALSILSRAGCAKLFGSNTAGLPQPIPNPVEEDTTIIIVPIGARWANGFNVKRPVKREVSSPSRSFVQQWANSCNVTARIKHRKPDEKK